MSETTISLIGVGIAVTSLVISIFAYFASRSSTWSSLLMQVADRLETDEMRRIRHSLVYRVPRPYDPGWIASGSRPEETRAELDRWGAEMDLLALLLFSRQLKPRSFFEMYGDVILRSAFLLASYAELQRRARGDQFWLPFERLTKQMLKLWKQQLRKRRYPKEIGIPGSELTFSPTSFEADNYVRSFLNT